MYGANRVHFSFWNRDNRQPITFREKRDGKRKKTADGITGERETINNITDQNATNKRIIKIHTHGCECARVQGWRVYSLCGEGRKLSRLNVARA